MTVTYHRNLIQGSDEWLAERCGLMTASEMHLVLTPTLKMASNEKERLHLFELLAQRATKYVEPRYVSDDMLRGIDDEIDAKLLYDKTYAHVEDCGFITNDRHGFMLGYSPDGLVGNDGQVEFKSRRQKFQVQTIIDREIPAEYILQVQTGLLVSERAWCDFGSYCGGLPMVTMRAYPDDRIQSAIVEAAGAFEGRLREKLAAFNGMISSGDRFLVPTERKERGEIVA